MRKYFFVALAIVLAIFFSGFKKSEKKINVYMFRFDFNNASTLIKTQVEDESRWLFDRVESWPDVDLTCVQSDEQACEIAISLEFLDCIPEEGNPLNMVASAVIVTAGLEFGCDFQPNVRYAVELWSSNGIYQDYDTIECSL